MENLESKYVSDYSNKNINRYTYNGEKPSLKHSSTKPEYMNQVCDVASSAYLPHSGKSRLGCEAGTVMKFVFIPFVYCWRTGSD